MEGDPPAGMLAQAGLALVPDGLPAGRPGLWLADWDGTLGVLRRLDPAPDWAAKADLAADSAWLHGFLGRLADGGFPAPRPLPAFGQRSWTVTGTAAWELVSFVPGRAVGSASGAPMTRSISRPSRRPARRQCVPQRSPSRVPPART